MGPKVKGRELRTRLKNYSGTNKSGAVSSRQGRFAFEIEHQGMCGGWTRGGRESDKGAYRGSLELTVELEAWTECRGAGVMWAQPVPCPQ